MVYHTTNAVQLLHLENRTMTRKNSVNWYTERETLKHQGQRAGGRVASETSNKRRHQLRLVAAYKSMQAKDPNSEVLGH